MYMLVTNIYNMYKAYVSPGWEQQIMLSKSKSPPALISSKKFWEELISYFPLIRYGPHRKRHQQFLVAAGTYLPSPCLATIEGYTDRHPQTLLWYDTDRIENDASNSSSIVACIRCRGNGVAAPLPSNDREGGYTWRQTDGRDSWNTPLRWSQVLWLVQAFKSW
jgi:hypothetical protein